MISFTFYEFVRQRSGTEGPFLQSLSARIVCRGTRLYLSGVVWNIAQKEIYGIRLDNMICESLSAAAAEEFYIENIIPDRKPIYTVLKKIFDLFFSAVAIIVLFLPMVIISFLVKIDSPGPILFSQDRIGENGKQFVMYKFRTMSVDAEKDGPQWADDNDSRCTKIGRFLRRFHLDELPQLFNVFKGDMSIVGPRPERQCFYDIFETYIHGFSYRTSVKPGITGWAQVNGGYDLKPEEKIVYDMEYIKKRSLLLDTKCLFLTLIVVFKKEGAR